MGVGLVADAANLAGVIVQALAKRFLRSALRIQIAAQGLGLGLQACDAFAQVGELLGLVGDSCVLPGQALGLVGLGGAELHGDELHSAGIAGSAGPRSWRFLRYIAFRILIRQLNCAELGGHVAMFDPTYLEFVDRPQHGYIARRVLALGHLGVFAEQVAVLFGPNTQGRLGDPNKLCCFWWGIETRHKKKAVGAIGALYSAAQRLTRNSTCAIV